MYNNSNVKRWVAKNKIWLVISDLISFSKQLLKQSLCISRWDWLLNIKQWKLCKRYFAKLLVILYYYWIITVRMMLNNWSKFGSGHTWGGGAHPSSIYALPSGFILLMKGDLHNERLITKASLPFLLLTNLISFQLDYLSESLHDRLSLS